MDIMPDKVMITIVHLWEIGLQDGDLLDDLGVTFQGHAKSLLTHLKLCIMEIMPDKLMIITLIGNHIWASRWLPFG